MSIDTPKSLRISFNSSLKRLVIILVIFFIPLQIFTLQLISNLPYSLERSIQQVRQAQSNDWYAIEWLKSPKQTGFVKLPDGGVICETFLSGESFGFPFPYISHYDMCTEWVWSVNIKNFICTLFIWSGVFLIPAGIIYLILRYKFTQKAKVVLSR